MPQRSTLHIDQLLSNVSVRYQNSEYIAKQAFPVVPVKKDSDLYRVYERDFRIPNSNRADGAAARDADFEVSTSTYVLKWDSLKELVTDNQQDNFDMADLRADTTEFLTDKIALKQEADFCNLFTTTSWSLNHSLTTLLAWTNSAAANPIVDMDTACSVVINNSGLKPNFAILGRDGFVAAKNNPNVVDRVKYTSREIDQNILAALFGVNELLVSHAARDTAQEGLAQTVSQLWGDVAFVGYKPARPSPKTPSAGYTFEKTMPAVRRWRDEELFGEYIEVNRKSQFKVVASLAGYLIKDIV